VDADHRGGWTRIFGGKASEWRLLDRSKNTILPTAPAFGVPVGVIPSEFRRDRVTIRPGFPGHVLFWASVRASGMVFENRRFVRVFDPIRR